MLPRGTHRIGGRVHGHRRGRGAGTGRARQPEGGASREQRQEERGGNQLRHGERDPARLARCRADGRGHAGPEVLLRRPVFQGLGPLQHAAEVLGQGAALGAVRQVHLDQRDLARLERPVDVFGEQGFRRMRHGVPHPSARRSCIRA